MIGLERAIDALLPRPGAPPARAALLATLDRYACAVTAEARALGAIVPTEAEIVRALPWLLRPVFVCGHHRSGTTLLQRLLDGHPALLVVPSEATYFTSFAYVARRAPSRRALDRFAAEWVARFVDPNDAPHFRLGRSDERGSPSVELVRRLFGWQAALRDRVPSALAPLLALVAAFAAVSAPGGAPQRWVEKTPRNERHVGRFAFFAAARFIHVVRDPRAALASLATLYRAADADGFDAARHARAIGQSLRLARRHARRLGGRYLVVRYEDLVERPGRETERIRQFLEVAPHPTLTVPTASGEPVPANSSFDAGAPGVIARARAIPPLPDDDAALLGVFAAAAARAFGYEIPRPGLAARGALRLRHVPRLALRAVAARLRASVLRP